MKKISKLFIFKFWNLNNFTKNFYDLKILLYLYLKCVILKSYIETKTCYLQQGYRVLYFAEKLQMLNCILAEII